MKAHKVGSYRGKVVYRIPVRVRFNSSRLCRTVAEVWHTVLAHTPAEAANLLRDEVAPHRAEVEIDAYGPRGGATSRFIGWESHMFAALCAPRDPATQLPLPFDIVPA